MNRLSTAKRTQVIAALVEGNSINATCRMLGVGKHTVLRLLEDAGCACAAFHDANVRGLRVRRLQCDEIWAFDFMQDCAERIRGRVQITTDGHKAYLEAVEGAFGMEVDYAQLQKIYGAPTDADQRRYSPAKCIGADMKVVSGNPDPKHVSTSYVERQNLTIRMAIRRFTRLTNAFSKKLDNHKAACALHFAYYNFCRIHKSLRVTPAMEAGITDHIWSLSELLR